MPFSLNRRRSFTEKLLVFLLGIFFAILFLEAGLRIPGRFYSRLNNPQQSVPIKKENSEYTILCVGDSFTRGVGSTRGNDYPAQLERLLNSGDNGRKFRVINAGRSGSNSLQTLLGLTINIELNKPDLVVFLSGGSSVWNNAGYSVYLNNNPIVVKLREILQRSSIIKLSKLVYFNLRGKYNEFKQASIRNLPFDAMDKDKRFLTSYGVYLLRQERYGEALQWFKDKIAEDGDGVWYCGVGWVYRELGEYPRAVEFFKQAIDKGAVMGYSGLALIYSSSYDFSEAELWIKKGLSSGANYFLYGILANMYRFKNRHDLALEYIKTAIDKEPGNSNNYVILGLIYRDLNQHAKSIDSLEYALKLNPCDKVALTQLALGYKMNKKGLYELAQTLKKTNSNCYVVKDFIKLNGKKRNSFAELSGWVRKDINKAIEICKKMKIAIILQNYPVKDDYVAWGWYREINLILEQIAGEQGVPLVDNSRVFDGLDKNGRKKIDYFNIDTHCNDWGYKLMAGNIREKILEIIPDPAIIK